MTRQDALAAVNAARGELAACDRIATHLQVLRLAAFDRQDMTASRALQAMFRQLERYTDRCYKRCGEAEAVLATFPLPVPRIPPISPVARSQSASRVVSEDEIEAGWSRLFRYDNAGQSERPAGAVSITRDDWLDEYPE